MASRVKGYEWKTSEIVFGISINTGLHMIRQDPSPLRVVTDR